VPMIGAGMAFGIIGGSQVPVSVRFSLCVGECTHAQRARVCTREHVNEYVILCIMQCMLSTQCKALRLPTPQLTRLR